MRTFYFSTIALLLLFSLQQTVVAQDLTVKEGGEITYQAKRLVDEYQNLLNTVSNSDIGEADTKTIIENSYTDLANKIFFNAEVIIQDDIDPRPDRVKDFSVNKYLNNLDLVYTKSPENSIVFSNITVSNVKNKDFYYIKVYFESTFNNRHRKLEIPYKTIKRFALVRADKEGKKWKTYIIGISFYKQEDQETISLNDIKLIDESATGTDGLSAEETQKRFDEIMRSFYEKEAQEKETEYKQAVSSAKEAEAKQDYVAALDNYIIARDLFKRTDVVKKVLEIGRIIEEKNNWKLMKEQGDLAASLRNYSKAVDWYNQSLRINPSQPELVTNIKSLTQNIEEVSLPQNFFDQGKYEDALKECNQKIKKNKKNNTNIPELYLIRGNCYLKLKDERKAQEEYTEAINIDRNFLDARLARAALHEKKNELANAIADYDAITQSIAPNDAAFHAKKATLKVSAGNRKGAIADYEKAISLNLKNPFYPYEKGLLHYLEGDFEKAQASFDNAILLDANYTHAYFQRGRSYIKLNHVPEAARDFFKAKKLGLDKAAQQDITQISSNYYQAGLDNFRNKKYEDAIAQFNHALTINPSYAEASYAKGEADYELKDYETAKGDYSTAIDLNKNYAEAHYKRGMAEYNLREYPIALNDFKKAVDLKADYFDALIGRGNTHMQLKSFQNATFDFQKAIVLLLQNQKAADDKTKLVNEAKLADSYNSLGRCKYEQKDFAGAIAELKNATKYNKNFADALYNRGLAYYEANDQRAAIEDLTACLALNPKRYEAYYARAKANGRYDKYDKAVSDYTVVIGSDSVSSFKDVVYLRGLSYAKLHSYDLALKDYDTYSNGNPLAVDSKLYTEIGFLHLNKNQFEKANENFNLAYDLDNKNATAMYGLGFSYAQMNGVDKSLEWLEKAFTTNTSEWAVLKRDEYLANIKGEKNFKGLKSKYKVK
ncbi:MAG: tetratricopeptide repeat protein [Bacteroidota bacterium]